MAPGSRLEPNGHEHVLVGRQLRRQAVLSGPPLRPRTGTPHTPASHPRPPGWPPSHRQRGEYPLPPRVLRYLGIPRHGAREGDPPPPPSSRLAAVPSGRLVGGREDKEEDKGLG